MNRLVGHDSKGLARVGVLMALAATAMAAHVGCGVAKSSPADQPESTEVPAGSSGCVDADGDGFGYGCGNGADCDDTDATVTTQCYGCANNATGCACSTPGQTVSCGELAAGSDGAPGCMVGQKVCQGGVWSDCQLPGKTMHTMGLSSDAGVCVSNPCDPYCQHFPDTPDPSLSNFDAGIIGTEAGLQLIPTPVDAGPPAECVAQTAEATPIPVDICVMLDISGSMGSGGKYTAVKTALTSFVNSSQSAGMYMSLSYFPADMDPEACGVENYLTPSVPLGLLPGNASAITTSLGNNGPTYNTPTRAALQGIIDYARGVSITNPTHKPVVVLATDGEPNVCNSTLALTAAEAYGGFTGGPAVQRVVPGTGAFIDISGTGTPTNITGDDVRGGSFDIGFSFPYYGSTYTRFWVSTNGWLTVTASPSSSYNSNEDLPTSGGAGGMIAPFWDDMDVNGNIYYKKFGTSPNQYLVVQWANTTRYGSSSVVNFEAILFENGDISFRYGALPNTTSGKGGYATVGVQNANASDGESYLVNHAVLTSNSSVEFKWGAWPSIPTYVIGIGSSTGNLNTIASSGGTTSAYMVTGGDATAFLNAMNAIRQSALGCDYSVPTPSTGNLDVNGTVVTYKLGATGTPVGLSPKSSEADCGTADGFFYDDPAHPTKITLCPTTCNTVRGNSNYKVGLTFMCKASCGSSESSVEPVPLDMYVMLDKSGSMGGSKWTAVTGALSSFVGSSSSSGMSVGLSYFPSPGDSEPADCPISNYSTPSVPVAILPGNASAITTSLSNNGAGGNTPTRPALEGAVTYARAHKQAVPSHKNVVVLATDGDPNICTSTVPAVAAVAQRGYLGTDYAITPVAGTTAFLDLNGQSPSSAGASGMDDVVRPNNSTGFDIGFTFTYFGQSYTKFWVDSNGWLTLGSLPTDRNANTALPNDASPNPMLAAFWDDLVIPSGTDIYYKTLGTAPNRTLVVQWRNAGRYNVSGTSLNFEIILSESGGVSYRYATMSGTGSNATSATIGLEDPSGFIGSYFTYNTAVTLSNTSVDWTITPTTYPSIPTYVIGIGSVANLDTIAAAGGTGSAFIVTGGDSSSFLTAMQTIRQSALGCEYNIPSSSLGTIDPAKMTVRYTPNGTGTPSDLAQVANSGSCGSLNAYYYDDPVHPTKLTLCPSACSTVGADPNAKLAIFYDCKDAYYQGEFTRDYNAGAACPPSFTPVWANWSWSIDAPGTSHVDFTVAVADTQAGLATATQYPLRFSAPQGPSSLVGQPIGAQAGTPDTRVGSASVDRTLQLAGVNRKSPYLRVRAKLYGSPPYYTDSPTLKSWDMQISCEATE